MTRSFESSGGSVPQSIIETEAKQRSALLTVQRLSRMAGRELPIVGYEDGNFPDQPGVYLFDHDVISPGDIKDANFVMDRRKSSGAADSAHAVISGALQVEFAAGNNKEIEIGAKCYQKRTLPDRLARAHREVNFMRYMQRAGHLAIQPVGVVIATPETGSEVVLLTRWDDDLLTFDNNPWGRGPSRGTMEDAIKGASVVGSFNRSGLVHNDAKIKNVATNNRTGQIGMIDFETTSFFDLQSPIEAAAATHTDLGLFMKSLADKGFFNLRMNGYASNADRVVGAIQKICERGYLPQWENAPPEVQSAVYDEAVSVAERLIEDKLGTHATAVAV
jgi:hypothetical protein